MAGAALLFERVWPFVATAICIVAVFVVVSWLGLWVASPVWVRIGGVALFGVGIVGLIGACARLRLPTRREVLARLDRDSGLPHHPISAAEDILANPAADPATRAIWDLHRRRLSEALRRTRVALPSPRMVDRDPYAARAAILVVLIAAGFVAGPEKSGRLAAAFAWSGTGPAAGARLDAWIDPPGYTGKPPLVLLGAATPAPTGEGGTLAAPAGSVVVVRTSGSAGDVDVSADGGLKTLPAKPGTPSPATGVTEHRYTLAGNGHLSVGARQFALTSIPDQAPRITVMGAPHANASGSLALAYTIADDYGVIGAEAQFADPIVRGQPVTGRALVEPPHGVLSLPATPGGLGDGKTTLDLSDHPWAGATVTMTLTARDEGGNIGVSAPVKLTLPAKSFTNPLARALVEQRRNLVLDPDHRDKVTLAIEAMQLAPDDFGVPPAVYLGLHSVELRLAAAKADADLLGVADLLWAMALQIENGDLSKNEQDLRAAQKALQQAIERGASPEEIKRLTDALREQMSKYLAEMMRNAEQRAQSDPHDGAPDRNSRTITEQDLKSLMDRMEQAARNGDMAEAQRLLDQLNAIMENLKSAKRGGQQSEATREMNRSMNDLNRMLQDQGDVRDKTFQQNQGGEESGSDQGSGDEQAQSDQQGDGAAEQQPGQGSEGQGARPGQSGRSKPGYGGLRKRQLDLQNQLDAMQRKLRGLGMQGEQGFADAQQAMKDAEGALGRGKGDAAVEAQGRALDGLKKGQNGLAQQMAQGGQQGQQAQGQGGEQDGEDQQGQDDLDPLGRPRQGRGFSQGRDLDVSGGLAARAQQVLQELRRRLGDPTRTPEEQEYLERLLKRY